MNPSSRYHLKAYRLLLVLFLFSYLLSSSIFCDNNISDTTAGSSNNQFNKENLELPHVSAKQITIHNGYSLQYSELHEQPIWVAYQLTRSEVYCTTSRTEDFREDSLILSGSATNSDYENTPYVRGHLKSAADSRYSKEEMSASFLLSNISPMTWNFNEGLWLDLEKRFRDWAVMYDTLFIITGPILSDSLESIGSNKVTVPKYFYKSAIEVSGDDFRGIAFIVPHDTKESDFMDFSISIDSLESILGIDLFSNLPDSLEKMLESETLF